MNNNDIRLEDFETVDKHGDYFYAYNYLSGDCAVFDHEKKLILHEKFRGKGHFDEMYSFNDFCKNPKIISLKYTYSKDINKFMGNLDNNAAWMGVYSVENNSYILPLGSYFVKGTKENDILIFQSITSLSFINPMGEIDTLSFSNYFKTSITDPSECGIFHEENKTLTIQHNEKYGVYSWKERKMIVPIKFDSVRTLSEIGIIVTNDNEENGIYSYEGKILLSIKKHLINTFEDKKNYELISIKSNDRVGMYNKDFHCVLPKKYLHFEVWHPHLLQHPFVNDGDFFIIVETPNYYKGLYSVLMKKFIVPSKYEKLILEEKIIAIKRIMEPKVKKSYHEFVPTTSYEHNGLAIQEVDGGYSVLHKEEGHYDAYADIYSYQGDLLSKNITITIDLFK